MNQINLTDKAILFTAKIWDIWQHSQQAFATLSLYDNEQNMARPIF